jgi:hypothetical protein
VRRSSLVTYVVLTVSVVISVFTVMSVVVAALVRAAANQNAVDIDVVEGRESEEVRRALLNRLPAAGPGIRSR